MTIGQLVADSGLSRPTVRRLLLALIRAGFVEQDEETRDYALGPQSYVVGAMAARRFDLLDVASESLIALSKASGDSSFLSIRRGAYAVCLHREDGAFPIRTQALQAGDRHPLGVGAGSLAILAALPDQEVELMLEETRETRAERSPNFSDETIRGLIADARQRGWSLNPGLQLRNSWAIGAAIIGVDDAPIGALSIAALDSRMTPERQHELAPLLQREARAVEARLRRRMTIGTRELSGREQGPAEMRRANGRTK